MADSAQRTSGKYFIDELGPQAFNTALGVRLRTLQKETLSRYMSSANTHRFQHGGEWRHPGIPEATGTGMQRHSAVVETRFQELVDNDLNTIDRISQEIVDAMNRQFEQMLFSTVSAACDRIGNTVDAKAEKSLLDAFIATIEKIEFVADKEGQVKFPDIHASPETAARIKAELEKAPPEFKERLDALTARKIKEAKEREAERKARFACYGDKS